MKVTRENGENQQVTLTIEAPAGDWDKAIDAAAKRATARLTIPGFRKGKAPRHIVEMTVGTKAILDDAYETFGTKLFRQALADEKINLAARPSFAQVAAQPGQPLVFKATVTPMPEVALGEYKGLKMERKVVVVTDEQVAAHLDKMRDRKAKIIDAPEGRPVEKGDLVMLDFTGYVDGQTFQGGEGKGYPLQIGSGSFIPGFEEQLIGAEAGKERDVSVTFPEDYHEKSLAGKAAVFKCTVRKVKQRELPPLDDEFAKTISSFQSLAELKADVRANLERQAAQQADNERGAAIIDLMGRNASVEVPPAMVEERISQMVEEMAMRLQQQGVPFEQYLKTTGAEMAKIREGYRETATRNVRTDLVLDKIAEAEGIAVTQADYDAEVATMARMYGATPAQVESIISEQQGKGSLATTIRRRKTARFVVDSATE